LPIFRCQYLAVHVTMDGMGNWPNWKDLKKSAKIDPAKAEELRRGLDNGRRSIAARLAGPAAHMRTVGQEFKAGLTEPEPPATPAAPAADSANSADSVDPTPET
jgi:hypothetical protein